MVGYCGFRVPGIGQGPAPLIGVPALDVVELLEEYAERLRIESLIKSICTALEVGDTSELDLNTRCVPRTFEWQMGEGRHTFVVSENGHMSITRTA